MSSVLVVDDTILSGKILTAFFGSFGCSVTYAKTADEAIAAAREEQPKLILMDIYMPGVRGDEVMKRIKEDAACAHIPIYAHTAAGRVDRDELIAAGFTGVIIKPLMAHQITDLIAKYNLADKE